MLVRAGMLMAFLFLVSCATPPEVKQLSIKQNEYFDAAIAAVRLQSEALVAASEKLVDAAKERIDQEESAARKDFEELMQNEKQSAEDAAEISRRIAETSRLAEQARKSLEDDLTLITKKSEELARFLEKMKEVNVTLDAYIQSEKAGEAVVRDVMNNPTVSGFLGTVSDLMPKVTSELEDLDLLLDGIR